MSPTPSASTMASRQPTGDSTRLPLFHINAEVVGLLATLVAGSTLVLDDRFHRTDFWALMARHEVTWINAVPAIIVPAGRTGTGRGRSPRHPIHPIGLGPPARRPP